MCVHVTHEKDVVHDVVHRVDLRAEVKVVLPPLVAEADLRKFGVGLVVEEVGLLVFFLVVYREECGALVGVLARRPGVRRVLNYFSLEQDGLASDDFIHPRDLVRRR